MDSAADAAPKPTTVGPEPKLSELFDGFFGVKSWNAATADVECADAVSESPARIIERLSKENIQFQLRSALMFHVTGGRATLPEDALCNITWQNISIDARLKIESVIEKEQRELSRSRSSKSRKTERFSDSGSSDPLKAEISMKAHGMGAVQYFVTHTDDRSKLPVHGPEPTTRAWDIPYYNMDLEYPLPYAPPPADPFEAAKPKCFNCGETDHAVAQCPVPFDAEKVRAARREFVAQRGAVETRYWDPAEAAKLEAQNKFVPGDLSSQLKEALGMKPGDIPPYYWRMQQFGYPPGYLGPIEPRGPQQADKSTPQLEIFDEAKDYVDGSPNPSSADSAASIAPNVDPRDDFLVPQVYYPGLIVSSQMLQHAVISHHHYRHLKQHPVEPAASLSERDKFRSSHRSSRSRSRSRSRTRSRSRSRGRSHYYSRRRSRSRSRYRSRSRSRSRSRPRSSRKRSRSRSSGRYREHSNRLGARRTVSTSPQAKRVCLSTDMQSVDVPVAPSAPPPITPGFTPSPIRPGVLNSSDVILAPLPTDDPNYAVKKAAADKFWRELKKVGPARQSRRASTGSILNFSDQAEDMEIE